MACFTGKSQLVLLINKYKRIFKHWKLYLQDYKQYNELSEMSKNLTFMIQVAIQSQSPILNVSSENIKILYFISFSPT